MPLVRGQSGLQVLKLLPPVDHEFAAVNVPGVAAPKVAAAAAAAQKAASSPGSAESPPWMTGKPGILFIVMIILKDLRASVKSAHVLG